MSDKIKNCPFCNGEADFESVGMDSQTVWQRVMCIQCCAGSAPHETCAEAVEAWNTRVAQKVKPLEWEAEDGRPTCIDSEGCGKLYRVLIRHDGTAVLRHNAQTLGEEQHRSEKDAKAAAQADYERRILSALEV